MGGGISDSRGGGGTSRLLKKGRLKENSYFPRRGRRLGREKSAEALGLQKRPERNRFTKTSEKTLQGGGKPGTMWTLGSDLTLSGKGNYEMAPVGGAMVACGEEGSANR